MGLNVEDDAVRRTGGLLAAEGDRTQRGGVCGGVDDECANQTQCELEAFHGNSPGGADKESC
jgi:hypothetical protein